MMGRYHPLWIYHSEVVTVGRFRIPYKIGEGSKKVREVTLLPLIKGGLYTAVQTSYY